MIVSVKIKKVKPEDVAQAAIKFRDSVKRIPKGEINRVVLRKITDKTCPIIKHYGFFSKPIVLKADAISKEEQSVRNFWNEAIKNRSARV